MFKKYGRLIFLVILLVVVTEVTIYGNRYVDGRLESDKKTTTVDQLRNQLEIVPAKEGLNPYTEFWVYEIEHFRDAYPQEQKDLFDTAKTSEWNTRLTELSDLIKSENVEDKIMMENVRTIIKDMVGTNYMMDIFTGDVESGYFRTVILLMEDDAKTKA